MYILNTVY